MILPKITVITPSLNTGESIETVLFSVASQNYQNIEHFIVDGGSTDKTLQSVRKFQKNYKNIRLLTEKDSGIYDAMNKGLDLCTGDWIIFMGADDSLYNEHILTDLYEQGLFQDEQVVYGNVIIKGDAPWAKDNSIYDGPFTLEKLFKINISHQSIFYPRSVIRQVGYYSTKYKITSDWDYNLRCWVKYKFTYTDKIIAFFTTGGKSSEGGDYALQVDFPNNVIKYFNLDVNDGNLYLATSPFYYPVSRYRENEYLRNNQELKAETERLKEHISDQQTSHVETVGIMQKEHNALENAFRLEFNETLANLRSDQERFITTSRAEHDTIVQNLKTEHNQNFTELKEEHEHFIAKLRTDYNQNINILKEEHTLFVTNLKIEQEQTIFNIKEVHSLLVTSLRTEHDQHITDLIEQHTFSVAELESSHKESANALKSGYKEIIKSQQAEYQASRDFFRQKEVEFIRVIDSNNLLIDSLNRTLASNELLFKEKVEKDNAEISYLKAEIVGKDQYIDSIFNSYTWKIGKILLAPTVFIIKKLGVGRK